MGATNNWQKYKDEIGFVHTLDTGALGYFIKVEKTRGGDYAITAAHEDDPAGGDVEFRATLAQAKKFAEDILIDGTWVEYTADPCDAIAKANS